MLGGGAFCNGQKINVSQTSQVSLLSRNNLATTEPILFCFLLKEILSNFSYSNNHSFFNDLSFLLYRFLVEKIIRICGETSSILVLSQQKWTDTFRRPTITAHTLAASNYSFPLKDCAKVFKLFLPREIVTLILFKQFCSFPNTWVTTLFYKKQVSLK